MHSALVLSDNAEDTNWDLHFACSPGTWTDSDQPDLVALTRTDCITNEGSGYT